jgi:hypothetical protein
VQVKKPIVVVDSLPETLEPLLSLRTQQRTTVAQEPDYLLLSNGGVSSDVANTRS